MPDTPQILLAKTVSGLVSEVSPQQPHALLPPPADAPGRPSNECSVDSLRTSTRTTSRSTWPRAHTQHCRRLGTLFTSRKWPSTSVMWVTAPGLLATAVPLHLRTQRKTASCLFPYKHFPLCHFTLTFNTYRSILNLALKEDSVYIGFPIRTTMVDVGFALGHVMCIVRCSWPNVSKGRKHCWLRVASASIKLLNNFRAVKSPYCSFVISAQ